MVTATRTLYLAAMLTVAGAGVARASGPPADTAMAPLPPIVPCVLAAPRDGRLLQRLDGAVALYTHRCSGGLYLAADVLPDLRHAIPLLQGWWLHEFVGAHGWGTDAIEVCGRFITGIGPSGATPFAAAVHARRTDSGWQVDEPLLVAEATDGATGCE